MQWIRAAAAVALVGFLGCSVRSGDAVVGDGREPVAKVASQVSVSPDPSEAAGVVDSAIAGAYSLVAHDVTPQVAFGGSTYFVAWTEGRASAGTAIKGDSGQDIFATRLGETGEPLDAVNLQLSKIRLPPVPGDLQFLGQLSRERLRIAAGDAGAIAAWLESSTASDEVSIGGAIISTEGAVTRFTIEGVIRTYQGVDGQKNYLNGTHVLTADPGGYCVFYYSPNFGGGIDLAYRRITPDGVVGGERIAIANRAQPFNTYSFTASSNGSSAIFAWEPYMEVGGYFVTPFSGPPTATIHLSSNTSGSDGVPNPAYFAPHATRSNADGTHAIAITDGYSGLRTLNIDATGNIASLGTRVEGTANKNLTYFPDPSGGFDVGVWSVGDICVMQLTDTGASECKGVALDPDRNQPGYAFGQEGGAFGKTTFVESRIDNDHVKPAMASRYLKATATFETAVTLSKSANSEEAPSVATDGDGYVVLWRDTRTSMTTIAPSLYAMRLDANGAPASQSVEIAKQGIVATTVPKIIFDGSKYFATWCEAPATEAGGRLQAVTLPRTGPLVVEKAITVSEGVLSVEQVADVASDGANRIVVWSAFGSGGGIAVFGKRISLATDSVLDTDPISISANDSTFRGSAQIAFDGSRNVVTWIETVGGPRKIVGTFIEKGQGAPKETPKVFVNDGAFGWTTRLAAAPGRGSFLIWGSQSSDVFDMNVHGLFLSQTGETTTWNGPTKVQNDARASTPISVGPYDARAPAVAYAEDKANLFAVWEDNRAGNYDLRGTWIGANDGVIRDPNGVEVASMPSAEINPAIAMSKDGNGLVVYQEFVSGPTSNAYRLRLRKVNSGLILGTACTSNDACGTRQCVDGVCCESACEGGCGVCNATPGTCLPKQSGTACGHLNEYMCGGAMTSCPSSCTSNDECISHACTNGTCEPPETRCVDDFTLRSATGIVTPCGDYKCKNNACRNPCVDVTDCTGGLICSFDGACEPPPEVHNDPSPSCSMRHAGAMNCWPIGLLTIVLTLVRRRSSRAALTLGTVASLCGFLACSRPPNELGYSPTQTARVGSGEVTLGQATPFRASLGGFDVAHETLRARVEATGTLSVARPMSPPVTLSTESLGRTKAAAVNADAPSLEAGLVRRRFGRVIEKVEARPDGIETTWLLHEKPDGEGDFVVRQQVRSGRAQASGNGIRFADEHLNLSEGRFVDASGMSTLIPARLMGDVIEYRVAHEVIEASTYPAVLDPTISSDVLIKQDESLGYATQRVTPAFDSYDPSISFAFDGTNYLVAWCDTRALGTTVMAALVSKDGVVLSPDALLLGRLEVGQMALQETKARNLRVVAGGGGFMVTWSTSSSDGQLSYVARRLRANGAVVDSAPIDLGSLSYHVETSGNADGFYIVYSRPTSINAESFFVAHMKPATDSDPALATFNLGESPAGGYTSFIVRNDLLLYGQYDNQPGHMYSQKVFSARFGPNGALRSTVEIAPFPFASLYALAFDGTKYVVTGYDSGYVARYLGLDGLTLGASGPVDADVIAADADGLTTSSHTLPTQICNYAADFSQKGTCYLIPPEVFVARGPVLAVGTLSNTVGARGWVPVLRRLDRFSGEPLTASETVLARSANSQYAPSLAYDAESDTYVGVWIDDKDGDSAVVAPADGGLGSGGLRVTAATIRANGATFDVSKAITVSGAGSDNVADPDVVSLGSGAFFALWSEDLRVDGTTRHRIAGARIQFSAGGTASISPAVELATSASPVRSPRIAKDGTGPILTWTDGTAATGGRVLMKRVALDSSGDAGTPLVISASADGRWRPESAAVFDGKETLIAWIESDKTSSRVKGVVLPDGSQTPSATASSLETTFSLKEHLRIGTDNRGNALLTWSASTSAGREVRAIGISPSDLAAIDTRASFRVAGTTETNVSEPSIAYANDGESYAIVWSERSLNQGSDSLLHGTWVGLDGRVFDQPSGRRITLGASPSGFDASFETSGEDEGLPALATGPSSVTGLIYVRFDGRSGVRSLRAHFRTLSSGRANGVECSTNEECSSRYCVDSVCCDSACDQGCGQCGGASGGTKGQCAPLPQATICGSNSRYTCSGTSTICPSSCDNALANTCAPDYVCREYACSPAGGTCANEFAVASADGPVSCAPYKCAAGACSSTCSSVDDCSDGTVCDFSNRCTPAPELDGESPSCETSTPHGVRGGAKFLLGVGLAALVAARRQRSHGRSHVACPRGRPSHSG